MALLNSANGDTSRCGDARKTGLQRCSCRTSWFVAACLCTRALAQTPDKLYWAAFNDGTIMRANLADGSDVESIVSIPGSRPWGLAIDSSRCAVFWADYGASVIRKAHLDGTGVQIFIRINPADMDAVALWHSDQEDLLYWTTRNSRIYRTSLATDVRVVEELVTGSSGYFNADRYGLAVDTGVSPPMVYMADNYDWSISRATWGSSQEDVRWITDEGDIWQPRALEIDTLDRQLYIVDEGLRQIRRVHLDDPGANVVSVAAVDGTTPLAIAMDVASRKYYYSETSDGGFFRIRQMGIDGTPGWDLSLEGTPKPLGLGIMSGSVASTARCFESVSEEANAATANTTATTSTTTTAG